MNRKPFDSNIRGAIGSSVAAVEVPPFDRAAIDRRRALAGEQSPKRPRNVRRFALAVALPAILVVVVMLPTMPSVIAQVQRALQAFAVVNGQTVPLKVRAVSLEQARAQMPFQVIAPAAVPPGLTLTLNELYSQASPADARLIFQYHGSNNFPALTISESSVNAKGPTKLMVTERRTINDRGPLPAPQLAPPAAGSALGKGSEYTMRSVEVRNVNGHVTKQAFELHPIVWEVRGTRIVLAATPGLLSPQQVAAIRAAMSR